MVNKWIQQVAQCWKLFISTFFHLHVDRHNQGRYSPFCRAEKKDCDGCWSVVIYSSRRVSVLLLTFTLHNLCLSRVNCLFLVLWKLPHFYLLCLSFSEFVQGFVSGPTHTELDCTHMTGAGSSRTCYFPYLISAFFYLFFCIKFFLNTVYHTLSSLSLHSAAIIIFSCATQATNGNII